MIRMTSMTCFACKMQIKLFMCYSVPILFELQPHSTAAAGMDRKWMQGFYIDVPQRKNEELVISFLFIYFAWNKIQYKWKAIVVIVFSASKVHNSYFWLHHHHAFASRSKNKRKIFMLFALSLVLYCVPLFTLH